MKFLKKISIVIIIIVVFNLFVPKKVEAVSFAGKLVEPIVDFVVFLGDGVMDIVHDVIFGQTTSVVRVDLTSSTGEKILAVLGGIAVAALAAVLVVATAGLAAAAFAAIRSDFGCCICWNSSGYSFGYRSTYNSSNI